MRKELRISRTQMHMIVQPTTTTEIILSDINGLAIAIVEIFSFPFCAFADYSQMRLKENPF